MSTKSPSQRRRALPGKRIRRLLAVGALALPVLVGTAATSSADTLAPLSHPERDFAGSTIAAHEGNDGSPFSVNAAPGGLPGIDISHYQGGVDWAAVARENQFVYMKATEGTGYRDPNFNGYYTGSYNAGLIRGAYHFALPNRSSAQAQAQYFVNNGGGWSADGRTLPPMLDIEYNPYGATCYGLNQGQMSGWIAAFSNEVHRLTSRYPTIYTTRDWWSTCTGNNGGFGAANPLFIARYNTTVGTLPNGWGFYTFWQYTSTGRTGGIGGNVDEDVFNGSADRLRALALG